MRLTIALFLSLAASTAVAQSGIDCAATSSILRTGSLAAADSQLWAYATVGTCDTSGANAFAAAMRRRTTASFSYDLLQAFRPPFADTAVANAALDVATDVSASVDARALSLGLLAAYTGSADVPSTSMLSTLTVGDICAEQVVDKIPYIRSNLPANEIEIAKARLSALERDVTTPLKVRAGSNCVMNVWRSVHKFPQQPILSFSTPPLQLVYVCGTTFQLKNSGDFVLAVRSGPSGTDPLPVYSVPPKASGQTFGILEFHPAARGVTVQAWFDDQLVGSQKATGVGCP